MRYKKNCFYYQICSFVILWGLALASCDTINDDKKSDYVETVQESTNNWSEWEDYGANITADLYYYKNGWKKVKDIKVPDNETYDQYHERKKWMDIAEIDDMKVQRRYKGNDVEFRVYWRRNVYPISESPVNGYLYCFYYKSRAFCFNM